MIENHLLFFQFYSEWYFMLISELIIGVLIIWIYPQSSHNIWPSVVCQMLPGQAKTSPHSPKSSNIMSVYILPTSFVIWDFHLFSLNASKPMIGCGFTNCCQTNCKLIIGWFSEPLSSSAKTTNFQHYRANIVITTCTDLLYMYQ